LREELLILEIFVHFQQWYDSYEINNIAWLTASFLLFISFVLFLIASKKEELESRSRVYLGYGLFCLCFGLTRFLFVFADFFGDLHDNIMILGYLTGILGVIFVIFILETYLLKTKKILTIITSILSILILIALLGLTSRDDALMMIYIFLPAAIIATTITFIYFIINSTGTSRKKAIGALLGIIFIFFGHTMDSNLWANFFPDIPLIISPVVLIFGIIFFTSSQLYGRRRD